MLSSGFPGLGHLLWSLDEAEEKDIFFFFFKDTKSSKYIFIKRPIRLSGIKYHHMNMMICLDTGLVRRVFCLWFVFSELHINKTNDQNLARHKYCNECTLVQFSHSTSLMVSEEMKCWRHWSRDIGRPWGQTEIKSRQTEQHSVKAHEVEML